MTKKILWKILCKYDNLSDSKAFCNSLSRVIQDIHTQDDLINIITLNPEIEVDDLDLINKFCPLTEVIF